MAHGTVITGRNNIFTVLLDGREYECRIKGKRLHTEDRAYNPLAPGDEVSLSDIDDVHGKAVIVRRLPRTSSFVRFNRKRNAAQTLAVGVAQVLVVVSVREPEFRPRFVDRCLALAENEGIRGGVIVNKIDLDPQAAGQVVELYGDIGYLSIGVSAMVGTGLNSLRDVLANGRSLFVGQSGVGKSTIVNGLLGWDMQQVGAVSHRYRRGRHTTNAARLIFHDSLEIVDTPGIRELDVRTITIENLGTCFREFRRYVDQCEHSDCLHTDEPGCAVVRALEEGGVRAERYQSYRKLVAELRELEREPV